jgi:hypothetical protein
MMSATTNWVSSAPKQHGGRLQFAILAAELALQSLEVMGGQQSEVLVDNAQRKLACRVAGMLRGEQLQAQTLGDRAGSDARRIEGLHLTQRHLDILDIGLAFGRAQVAQLFAGVGEIARGVDRLDQRLDDRAIAR